MLNKTRLRSEKNHVMNGNIFKYMILVLLTTVVGCADVEFQNLSSGWFASSTTVMSNPKTAANGRSHLVLKLKVHDNNGNGVANVQLKVKDIYENMSFHGCTPSDASGVISCRFTSVKPGTTNIALFDSFGRFPVDVTFVVPEASNNSLKTAFTKRITQTVAGYSFSTNLGAMQGNEQKVAGYTINTFDVSEKAFE